MCDVSQKSVAKLVLECVDALVSSNENSLKGVVEKTRTRARSMPEEAFARGLAYALTFTASKGGKDTVETGLKASKCEDIISTIAGKHASEEELSYGLYGAIILYIAKNAGIIKGDKFEQVIYEILEKPAVIETRMWNVLDWFKRVAEAYIRVAEAYVHE